MLREELQLLHEPGSYVGEVVKVMSKTKVLVKVRDHQTEDTRALPCSFPALARPGNTSCTGRVSRALHPVRRRQRRLLGSVWLRAPRRFSSAAPH